MAGGRQSGDGTAMGNGSVLFCIPCPPPGQVRRGGSCKGRIALNIAKTLRTAALLAACWVAAAATAAAPDPVRFGHVAELGDLATLEAWLDQGLDPGFEADRIGSGLMIGAWTGNVPLMELFAARGADVNQVSRYGEQALQLAAWRGQREAVQWLLARGAAVNREGAGWSALHYAVFAGHDDLAALLLARGADVNARAPNQATPLMVAAREGREALAQRLLAAGADPRLVNDRGESALTWAMRYGRLRIARLVSSAAEFAEAAKAKPEDFGPPTRSEPAPREIDGILAELRAAQAEGRPVEPVRQALFDAVERFKAESRQEAAARAAAPSALVITGRRGEPGKERAELIYGAPPATVPEILAEIRRAEAAGRSTEALRRALHEAVDRFKRAPVAPPPAPAAAPPPAPPPPLPAVPRPAPPEPRPEPPPQMPEGTRL